MDAITLPLAGLIRCTSPSSNFTHIEPNAETRVSGSPPVRHTVASRSAKVTVLAPFESTVGGADVVPVALPGVRAVEGLPSLPSDEQPAQYSAANVAAARVRRICPPMLVGHPGPASTVDAARRSVVTRTGHDTTGQGVALVRRSLAGSVVARHRTHAHQVRTGDLSGPGVTQCADGRGRRPWSG